MPTYLNSAGGQGGSYALMGAAPPSFQHGGPNCRQIYEHVQGCPVCQQIFMGPGQSGAKQYHVMQQQRPPFVAAKPPAELRSVATADPTRQFMGNVGASGDAIEISPTVAFLVVVLIVILLVYMIRNLSSRN